MSERVRERDAGRRRWRDGGERNLLLAFAPAVPPLPPYSAAPFPRPFARLPTGSTHICHIVLMSTTFFFKNLAPVRTCSNCSRGQSHGAQGDQSLDFPAPSLECAYLRLPSGDSRPLVSVRRAAVLPAEAAAVSQTALQLLCASRGSLPSLLFASEKRSER